MLIDSIQIYVPNIIVTNDDLRSKMGIDTSDEWIKSRTGIEARRICGDDETACSMAIMAAMQCNLNCDKVKAIIVATSTHNQGFPSIAVHVHRALKLGPDVVSFDINDACNGFIQALSTAFRFLDHEDDVALVIGSDKMSSILNWNDRSTCVLFGDGAGVVAITKKTMALFDSTSYTLSDYLDSLHASPKIEMDGQTVFKTAVQSMCEDVANILSRNGIDKDSVDFFIPHQANARIIDAVKRHINLPESATVNVIANYGNTSAATIPIGLHSIKDRLKSGQIVLMTGFGAGFRGGSVLMRI